MSMEHSNTSTNVTQENVTQENATQNTQQEKGLSKGLIAYQVIANSLPNLGKGICFLVFAGILGSGLYWLWTGELPKSDVIEMTKINIGQ